MRHSQSAQNSMFIFSQPGFLFCYCMYHGLLRKLSFSMIESSWNVMAHGDPRAGKCRGKLANGVGSQYPSHYLGSWCIQHYYRWCAHLGCQHSTELTSPGWFKWTRPLRWKTKFGFCACDITFTIGLYITKYKKGEGCVKGSTAFVFKEKKDILKAVKSWSVHFLEKLTTYD